MKALVYKSPGKIAVEDIPVPSPKKGEVLVKVKKAGICGSDIGIIHGVHPRVIPPLIPGHEFAGEVVQIIPGDKHGFCEGDRVTVFPLIFCGKCLPCQNNYPHVCQNLNLIGIDCPGGFGEYVTVPVKHLLKLPDDVDYLKGALIEPLAVGIHSVEMCKPEVNDLSVVMGAGPIGLMVAFSLRHHGYNNIIVTDINEKRLARARTMGFEAVSSDNIMEFVMQRTSENGADIIYECAGAASAALMLNTILRPRGKAVIVSVHKKNPELNLRELNFKEPLIIGARVYTEANFREAVSVASALDENKIISQIFGVNDAVKAFEVFQNPEEDTCKVIINMDN